MSEAKRDPILKPCPWCGPAGTPPKVVHVETTLREGLWSRTITNNAVECTECQARGPISSTLAGAVETWNTGLSPYNRPGERGAS